MSRRISILAPIIIVVALLASLTPATYTAYSDSQPVTIIMKVDKGKFNGKSIESMGGRLVYEAELAPIVIVSIPGNAVGLLKNTPGVVSYSYDGLVYSTRLGFLPGPPSGVGGGTSQTSQVTPWGVDYINADLVWQMGITGFVDVNNDGDGEIEVAIMDTGVDADHVDLAANIVWGIAVQNGRISTNYNDVDGHGTHVSGTVAAVDNDIGVVGVAPGVEIYAVKVLGNSGIGSWSDLIIGIDLAVKGPDGVIDSDGDGIVAGDPDDDAPEVISMSLGGDGVPAELYDIIKAAYDLGIVLVAAAGNEGAATPSYPAAYPEVIAVGAVDVNGTVPYWSNRNPEVAAPGVDVLSTYPGDKYATLSGTSMATPHVSATVALIQAARLASGLPLLPPGTENDTTTATVRGVLHVTAVDMGTQGYDELYGYGVIDAYQAVNAALSP